MKKILIVGASSCIGSNLAVYLRKDYNVYGTYAFHHPGIDGVPTIQFAINEQAPILELVKLIHPNVIIYCAAETNLARCQQTPEKALSLNAYAAATFANATAYVGARFIYLSSSKVFSGKEGNYRETDTASPADAYGVTKHRAEELLERFDNAFILRLGTVFALGGLNSNSMLNRLLRSLWHQRSIRLISDEMRGFVSVDTVCQVIGVLMDAEQKYAGIYHLGSSAPHTYYTFAKKLASFLGIQTDIFKPTRGAEFHPDRLGRHENLTLNGELLVHTFSLKLASLEQSLQALRESLEKGHQ